jgi:phosphoribosylaminoimidazole-succinocarboxamide synthase
LIDETHRILLVIFTPKDTRNVKTAEKNNNYRKSFRRWLIENGFQGLEGQQIPNMTDEYIETVSERYIELYENILGEKL